MLYNQPVDSLFGGATDDQELVRVANKKREMAEGGYRWCLTRSLSNLEIYYPYKFSPNIAIKEFNSRCTDFDWWKDKELFNCIPISHLSHCTHIQNASGIPRGLTFEFIVGDKKPRKNSVKYDEINESLLPIPNGQTMLPGYLTWWGINVIPWYESKKSEDEYGYRARIAESRLRHGEVKNHEISAVQPGDRVYLAPYLQYIDGRGCSVYGSCCFTFPFQKLIKSYKESREDAIEGNEKKIYFKKAGTLLYRNEICYVIMVCMGKDLEYNPELKIMEGASEPDTVFGRRVSHFQSNVFIAPDGEVIDRIDESKNFYFHSQFPVKAIYGKPDPQFYHWDTLNFAFYYPNHLGMLKVESEPENQPNHFVKHDPKSCYFKAKSKPCPDIDDR